jgi:hypothetical protein
VNLAHGCHLLYGAQDLDMERDPMLEGQLVDVEAELVRHLEEMQATTTAHAPERGNPVSKDFDGISDEDLERQLRDLAIGTGLSPQDSAVRVAAVARMRAIDAELRRRAEERDQ